MRVGINGDSVRASNSSSERSIMWYRYWNTISHENLRITNSSWPDSESSICRVMKFPMILAKPSARKVLSNRLWSMQIPDLWSSFNFNNKSKMMSTNCFKCKDSCGSACKFSESIWIKPNNFPTQRRIFLTRRFSRRSFNARTEHVWYVSFCTFNSSTMALSTMEKFVLHSLGSLLISKCSIFLSISSEASARGNVVTGI